MPRLRPKKVDYSWYDLDVAEWRVICERPDMPISVYQEKATRYAASRQFEYHTLEFDRSTGCLWQAPIPDSLKLIEVDIKHNSVGRGSIFLDKMILLLIAGLGIYISVLVFLWWFLG